MLERGSALKPELDAYLREECRKRGLSMRRLSINAGLSPATVSNILNRGYQPTLTSLNLLADYLGVRRRYLWYLVGLIRDMDYGPAVDVADARLKHLCDRVQKLPIQASTLIINLMEAVLAFAQAEDKSLTNETSVKQHLYAAEEKGPFQHED